MPARAMAEARVVSALKRQVEYMRYFVVSSRLGRRWFSQTNWNAADADGDAIKHGARALCSPNAHF
jgi:hypothetical protein